MRRGPGLPPEPPPLSSNWRRQFEDFTEDRDWRRGPIEPPLGADRDPRRRFADPFWDDWNWRRWDAEHPADRAYWTRTDYPRPDFSRYDYLRGDYARPEYGRPDYPRPEYPRPDPPRRPSRPDPLPPFVLDPEYFPVHDDELPVPDSPSTTTATSTTTDSTPTSNTGSVAHTHWLPLVFEQNRSTTRFPIVGQMFVKSVTSTCIDCVPDLRQFCLLRGRYAGSEP